ncbi:MAG TPA: tripartite tricarboxylate transporter substrate-binding protein [Ramlibacter sp.]
MHRRQLLQCAAAAAVFGGASPVLRAQALERAQVFIGFPPGSGPDILARRFAERLRPQYASTVIVENRVGSSGQLAVTALKNAKPDGSSFLLTPMGPLTIFPHTYKSLPYDPVADLTPVSGVAAQDIAFAVGPAVPAEVRTIPEFMKWAKADPRRATVGSGSAGSALHFMGVLLGRASGVEISHVGYRGTVAAFPDLAGGRLPAHVSPLGEVLTHLREGRLRVLGTSGAKRSRFTPEIATFAEQGFTSTGNSEPYSILMPARAPAEAVARLNAAVREALASPEMQGTLNQFALEPMPTTPAELAGILAQSTAFWKPVVKSIGFTAES